MGILPDFFVDEKLRASQDVLDGQWKSLNGLQSRCDGVPDSSWVEFVNDFRNWQEFYASESDWSADAHNATNVWQAKAKEWAEKFSAWGCVGTVGSVGGIYIEPETGPNGIPGVKEPPPDTQSIVARAGEAYKEAAGGFLSSLKTIGWVSVGIIVLIVLCLGYVLTKTTISLPQGSIG